MWLLFDDDQVYVVARCWESRPDRVIASEMRRDNIRIVRDDNFAWSFDTFYSRRNGVLFEVSAVGGRLDAEVVNESQINLDWNPVYDVAVGRFEGGWAMETALPFKSLRYPGAGPQTWGFQGAAGQPLAERVVLPHPPLGRPEPARALPGLARRHPRGHRRRPEASRASRGQAVPHRGRHHRRGVGVDDQRSGRRHGHRRQVRRHPGADRRLHRQPRLRAGRGRRAADQPDPLQPVLPREARVLPREPGDVQLRGGVDERPARRRQRHAHPLLQPAHRPPPDPGGAVAGGGPADRPGGLVDPRRAQHPLRRARPFRARAARRPPRPSRA